MRPERHIVLSRVGVSIGIVAKAKQSATHSFLKWKAKFHGGIEHAEWLSHRPIMVLYSAFTLQIRKRMPCATKLPSSEPVGLICWLTGHLFRYSTAPPTFVLNADASFSGMHTQSGSGRKGSRAILPKFRCGVGNRYIPRGVFTRAWP